MGRLHCRYTLSGADAADVGARLDRVAAQAVTRTGSALQELLGDTPAVYVLRDVTTRHRWSVTQLSDDELGELWGRGIATALVRAIAGDPGGGSNLIRFSDHADYVASFVADLVDGSAWSHWWYGAFTPYAARPRRQALLDVLLEHRAGLAGILAVLYRRGALGRVVDALGEPARRVLWGAPVVPPPQDREAVRPLLAAAIELARALGLWAGRLDQAAALDRYVATGPRERAWSDPRDLADGVWEAFRWLDSAGALKATAPGQARPAVAGAAGSGVAGPGVSGPADRGAAGLVDAALAPLDWLDQALLRERLRDHLTRGSDAQPAAGREAVRPLLAAAIELARALRLWAGRLDQAAALDRYVATGPRERAWSDPRDLADGVWEAFRWLDSAGALKATAPGQARPAVAGAADSGMAGPAALVDAALAPLDWLDQALLRERLRDHLTGGGTGGDLPVRPPLAPTPRQEELVLALLRLARSGVAGLDPADPASTANALRLYAALADSAPQFRDDPSVPPLVQRLLGAWSWVAAQAWPAAALDRLRRGDIPPAPAAAAHPAGRTDGHDAATLQFVAGLGAPAADLLEALGARTGGGQDQDSPVSSACAGVVLLLRTVTDLRLSALADRAGFPPGPDASPAALLLALGRRWAGPGGAHRGRVDAGLTVLAGLDTPPTLEAVGRTWSPVTSADVERFERTWLATLAGQGMLDDEDLHLHLLSADRGRMAAVAGTAAGLWPLGRLLRDTRELPAILAGWLTAWEAETGLRPSIHCDAALVDPLQARLPGALLVPAHDGNGTSATHRSNRSAFLRMHRALRWGRAGRPGPDLLVELMASGLVRLWARWLRGFSAASVPYLLDELVRRPGLVCRDGTGVYVELDPRPLDVVLEIAGYIGDLSAGPLPGERDVTIRIRRM